MYIAGRIISSSSPPSPLTVVVFPVVPVAVSVSVGVILVVVAMVIVVRCCRRKNNRRLLDGSRASISNPVFNLSVYMFTYVLVVSRGINNDTRLCRYVSAILETSVHM